MTTIHNSTIGQMENEKKLKDFLMEYATLEEIEELHLHIDQKDYNQADMVVAQIMARIT